MELPKTSRLPSAGPVQFLREVVSELKKVNWPTKNETIRLTGVVIIISAVVAAFIGGLDWVMINLTATVFKK